MHRTSSAPAGLSIALLNMLVGGCSGPEVETVSRQESALTAAQCTYFAESNKVTICHRTDSKKAPYTIVKTSVAGCGGHSGHEGDYVAYGDPTCNGQGCFPEGAPYDGTVECCEGLIVVGGTCVGLCNGVTCTASDQCHAAGVCDPARGVCSNPAKADGTSCSDGNACTQTDTCHAGVCTGGGSAPCQNGGECVNGGGSYMCTCAPGFSGANCETNIDDCAGNPCQNGGACTDAVNGYSCACAPGFSGANCETNIDDCTGNPCQNGGACTDGINGYSCACAAGFSGANCETNIDDCAGNPCQNGGACTDGINGYSCACANGYTGTNCETPPANQCPQGSSAFGGMCYQVLAVQDVINFSHGIPANYWVAGDAACAALHMGGHLTSINSGGENVFVAGLTGQGAMIGFSDKGRAVNDFAWFDGSFVAYTNWFPGEPNNRSTDRGTEDCARMDTFSKLWNDVPCTDGANAVCKFAP